MPAPTMPRFYCPLPLQAGRTVVLPDAVARHAVGALRLRDGDSVTLFNGDGDEYLGALSTRGSASVTLHEQLRVTRESPLQVTLAQGLSSGERMDYTLQKSVELGIAAIQPLAMLRSIVRLDADKAAKRRMHWQGVVVSACEQCGRNRIPDVAPLADFTAWRRDMAGTASLRLLLDPLGERSLADLARPEGEVVLLAGPEGGLDPRERETALAAGFIGVRLGPRVLRTETAALAALAAMQTLWGDYV